MIEAYLFYVIEIAKSLDITLDNSANKFNEWLDINAWFIS